MNSAEARLEPLGGGMRVYVTPVHGFGTDAVLLARFAAPKRGGRQADLCSGCGIIPLLWCRDNPSCRVDSFELLPEAAELARMSARENGLAEMRVFTQDLRTIPLAFAGCYDLVTCNPPYRSAGTGRACAVPARETARGEKVCTLDDAVRAGARLLSGKGRLCLCHRPARLAELFMLLAQYRLEPKRLRLVQRRQDTPPWLVLVEARKDAHPGLDMEPVLVCEQNGEPSPAWREIYGMFCP